MTALIVVVTTFLVPATARADVTDVNLSVAFDRLSADRVAAITLTAKSASEITEVKAIVEHQSEEGAWSQLATVPLSLADGTANDGTWTAGYQTDVEAHPGATRFIAEITSAGEVTRTNAWQYIDNCYELSITGITSSPAAIDADTPLTIAGTVLAQKTRDAQPEPAADVPVWNVTSPVRTGADGTFSFTHLYTSFTSLEAQAGWGYDQWCEVSEFAPSPEITRQTVELSAEIVTPQPVKAGDEVTVEGRLQRNGADGLVPVAGVWVAAHVTSATKEEVASTYTKPDGTFRMTFAAKESGPLTVQSAERDIVWSGTASPGQITVEGDPQFSEVELTPSPVDYEKPIRATGLLADGGTPIADATVWLLYSPDGENWQKMKNGQTTSAGRFDLQSTETTQDGFWRVWYQSADGATTASSDVHQVKVRFGTLLDEYKAVSGPGATVTVQGRLLRHDGSKLGQELPIYVYFMAEGESTWELQGTTTTSVTNGTFSKQFTSYQDGYWTAAFWGNDDFTRSNAPIEYVDVPGQYTTKFAEFGASPATVPSGESITVKGLLTRSVGGGAAEAAPEKPVYVYFLPAGSQTWEQKALLQTGADGRFEKAFTAEEDGYWTAWFFGDEGHLSVNSGSRLVDVR
ncbi:hypothetical protein [Actinomadura algeriensis]|uniref:5-hydroxyisourate hydrolase-like protein (Transthyretin family) n=1 Tax=Actinomadura algeriensis TaxID=1679523 RepID=A0ABR9JS54_9ACTN|nr:hypothetical protein [Actinomadura algeriensis]MBE1533405.1 5-hydroxyisourate hydrolase-like protein (transthyretin family) [Actinomadura algeriensis]